jgi:hypothetical protein
VTPCVVNAPPRDERVLAARMPFTHRWRTCVPFRTAGAGATNVPRGSPLLARAGFQLVTGVAELTEAPRFPCQTTRWLAPGECSRPRRRPPVGTMWLPGPSDTTTSRSGCCRIAAASRSRVSVSERSGSAAEPPSLRSSPRLGCTNSFSGPSSVATEVAQERRQPMGSRSLAIMADGGSDMRTTPGVLTHSVVWAVACFYSPIGHIPSPRGGSAISYLTGRPPVRCPGHTVRVDQSNPCLLLAGGVRSCCGF